MTEKKRTLSDLAQFRDVTSSDNKTESVVKENMPSMIASIIRATEASKEDSRPASVDSATASMNSAALAQQLALTSVSSGAFAHQSIAEQMEKKMLAHQVNSVHLSSLEDLGRQLKPYPDLANFLSTAIPGYDGLAALEHRLVRGTDVSELIAKKAKASSILNENQTHLRDGLNQFNQRKDLLAVSNKIPDHILNLWVSTAADFQRQIDDYKNPLGSPLIDYEKQKRGELKASKSI